MPIIKKQGSIQSKSNKKGANVLDRIKPIGFDEDAGIKVILYGQSGSGKTTLWSTFPKPILGIVVSVSANSGETRSIDTPENRKVIHQVIIEQVEEIREVIAHAHGKYKTLVLDHVTGLQDMVLKEILGLDSLPTQKSWGLASQQQYGQCTLQCKELMKELLGFDGNVVLVGQERTFNDDDTGRDDSLRPTVGIALSPSLAGWCYSVVDYVCQTFKQQKTQVKVSKIGEKEIRTIEKLKGVNYCLRTGPDATFHTKFRFPRAKGETLPDAIIDPTYEKLIKIIRG